MTFTIGNGIINKNRTIKQVINHSVYLYMNRYIQKYKTVIQNQLLDTQAIFWSNI